MSDANRTAVIVSPPARQKRVAPAPMASGSARDRGDLARRLAIVEPVGNDAECQRLYPRARASTP